MGKGSAPSSPDPYASASAQYQYGTQAAAYNAELNRINQTGPTGSTTYQVTGTDPTTGAPIYSENTQLTGPEQQLLAGQQQLGLGGQGLAGQELQAAQQTMQNNPLPTLGQNQDFGAQARKAAYSYATSTMDPYWNQEEEKQDASLRNAGATPGTPAYDNAMTAFHAQRDAAYSQAENQAFGQGLTAQGQQIQQIGQEQQIPLNEFEALSGGTQVNTPSAGQPAQATTSAPDIMQAFQNQYQGQLAGYNANVASSNADLSALAGIASAFIAASDERIKKDIKPLNIKTPRGNALYEYRFNFQPKNTPKQIGVMAQEVEKRTPAAVYKDTFGIRHVDYARV